MMRILIPEYGNFRENDTGMVLERYGHDIRTERMQ